MIDRLRMTS